MRAAAFPALVAAMVAPAAIAAPWQLDRSDVFTVRSNAGEDYRIMVAWPEGSPPDSGWPVLWLLDGEDNFALAATTARRLERARARSGVEPGMIVAIDSGPLGRRSRDFTPTILGYSIPPGTPGHGLPTGGAQAYAEFLYSKVGPAVAARWRIDAQRQTLAGHSFGGLFAEYEIAASGRYQRYALISPSLWFGEGVAVPRFRSPLGIAGKKILIAESDVDDRTWKRIVALGGRLTANGAQVRTLRMTGQNHGSTMAASIAQTISLAFAREPQP